jgi:hypothetical protein
LPPRSPSLTLPPISSFPKPACPSGTGTVGIPRPSQGRAVYLLFDAANAQTPREASISKNGSVDE